LKWAGPGPDQWVGPDPAQNQKSWLLCTHSNQPPHHLLQNVNYSRSACKCRQGLSKKKQTGATGGYLGWRRGGAAGGGSGVVAMEGLRWPAELLLPLPLPPLFFLFLSFLLLFPLSFLSSLVFSRLSLFFFFSVFFLLSLSLTLFFFFFSNLLFLCRSFFFCVSFLPCIYKGEKEIYTPAQSMAQGCRVDGAATVQPPLYHPRDTSPPLTLTRGKLCRWRVPGRHLFGSPGELCE